MLQCFYLSNSVFIFKLVIRDYDGHIYMRHYEGGILFGGFEKEAKPIFHESSPKDFENSSLPPDLDHFCNIKFKMPSKLLHFEII